MLAHAWPAVARREEQQATSANTISETSGNLQDYMQKGHMHDAARPNMLRQTAPLDSQLQLQPMTELQNMVAVLLQSLT